MGQCLKIFDLYFFLESNPFGPYLKRLKRFFLKIHFREDIRIQSSTPRRLTLSGVEYLGENEFWSKTILACLSGAQMASIHEIKKLQKISWHCPFKHPQNNLYACSAHVKVKDMHFQGTTMSYSGPVVPAYPGTILLTGKSSFSPSKQKTHNETQDLMNRAIC